MPYILLTLSTIFWSGNFVLSKLMATAIPPVALVFWRWFLAGLILAPFGIVGFVKNFHTIRLHLKNLLLLSFLGVTIFNVLVYSAMHYTTAINAVLVNSFTPMIIFILSSVIYKEKIRFFQFAGVIISFGGVFMIMAKGDFRILINFNFNFGDILVVLAAFSWGLYSVLLKSLPKNLDPITFLMTIIIFGLLFLVPIYIFELFSGKFFRPGLPEILSIAYVAVFASLLAFICWNRAVREIGANKAGPMVHLMPVFGSILSYLFLDEKIYYYHIIGILLVVGGIFTTTMKFRFFSK